MPQMSAFRELEKQVGELRHALENLSWAVVEAQPKKGPGHALVTFYDTATVDLIGLAHEASGSVAELCSRAEHNGSPAVLCDLLLECQDRLTTINGRMITELVALEWTDALSNLATERGGVWARWVHGVKDGLTHCAEPLACAERAAIACWKDVNPSAHSQPPVAQATAAATQILFPPDA